MSAQSQLDHLVHNIVASINDILSPLTTVTDDAGNVYKVWDEEHAVLGSDGKGPGEELFSRNSVSRYEKGLGCSDISSNKRRNYGGS